MRTWIGILAVAVALATSASAGKKTRPARKPSTKTAAAKGFYKILVKPNAKWVLHETLSDDGKPSQRIITVETYDVRKVGDANVARLRWTLSDGKDKQDVGASDAGKYTQVAVTAAGLYILSADMDDAKVAARLKDKPSRSDPPKAYSGTKQNQGRYLFVTDSGLVCLGEGPLPDAGPCDDTCDATMCLSATEGVVKLDGNWAPGVSIFAQKGYEDW